MISLCTVVISGMENYLKVLLHSVFTNCRHVKEIVIVKIDEEKDGTIASWEESGVSVRLVGARLFSKPTPFDKNFAQMICGHAMGMRRAVSLAREDYVWMCDPDVFFLSEVDAFYLRLVERHNLNIIGVSHFNAAEQSYGVFPCAVNALARRASLPDKAWLSGELYVQSGMRLSDKCKLLHPVDGEYLIPGPLTRYAEQFPNPHGIFDMGCNLWLWNHQRDGRWISFQLGLDCDAFKDNVGVTDLVYPMNYAANKYSSNFGLSEDLGAQDILYHKTRGSKDGGASFLALYESLFPEFTAQKEKKIYSELANACGGGASVPSKKTDAAEPRKLKWTIAIVNYKTSVYLRWQVRCFYEFNCPADFKLVIVDNSCDEAEFAALEEIVKPYRDNFGNVVLVKHKPVEKTASGQHGEGLTLILKKYTESSYILFQDPDFFWVKKDILNWFESFLAKDFIAVGAPYPTPVGGGHPWFPCLYGCAHRVADIKNLDCRAETSDEAWRKSIQQTEGWAYAYDVGYKIREELSSPSRADNFICLMQKAATQLSNMIGTHSYEVNVTEYFYRGERVAYHLFRGSFTGAVNAARADPKRAIAADWLRVRDAYGAFFYETLCNDGVVTSEEGSHVQSPLRRRFRQGTHALEFLGLLPFLLFYPLRLLPQRIPAPLSRMREAYCRRVLHRLGRNSVYMKVRKIV